MYQRSGIFSTWKAQSCSGQWGLQTNDATMAISHRAAASHLGGVASVQSVLSTMLVEAFSSSKPALRMIDRYPVTVSTKTPSLCNSKFIWYPLYVVVYNWDYSYFRLLSNINNYFGICEFAKCFVTSRLGVVAKITRISEIDSFLVDQCGLRIKPHCIIL